MSGEPSGGECWAGGARPRGLVFVGEAEELRIEGLRAGDDAGDVRIFFISKPFGPGCALFLTDFALLSLDLLLLLASSFSIALGKSRSCLQVGNLLSAV